MEDRTNMEKDPEVMAGYRGTGHHHPPTIYNVMKVIRKWRLLNACLLVISILILCRTLTTLTFTTVYIKKYIQPDEDAHPIAKPQLDNPKVVTIVKEIVTANEAAQTLLLESQEFQVRKKVPIPKIIHQIYRNESIPIIYADLIKSWIQKNPDYEYWFWDDISGRQFIASSYPEFLTLYDAYCHDLFRSDALRYFILYEFGGIYIDMDYQCLKSLDNLLSERHCHIVQEHGPQAQLLYNSDDMVLNAWMAAVPYHPFMNFLINNLASRAKCKFDQVLKSTGPLFVYDMKKQYYNITQCNNDICDINVLPYQVMMPEWDSNINSKKHQMRTCRRMIRLSPMQRKACIFFRKHRFNLPDKFDEKSYATHKFLHLGNEAKKYRDKHGYIDIRDIVPKVVFPMDKIINETNEKGAAAVTDSPVAKSPSQKQVVSEQNRPISPKLKFRELHNRVKVVSNLQKTLKKNGHL